MSRAWSGRGAEELTVDAVVAGELGPDDIRISPFGREPLSMSSSHS